MRTVVMKYQHIHMHIHCICIWQFVKHVLFFRSSKVSSPHFKSGMNMKGTSTSPCHSCWNDRLWGCKMVCSSRKIQPKFCVIHYLDIVPTKKQKKRQQQQIDQVVILCRNATCLGWDLSSSLTQILTHSFTRAPADSQGIMCFLELGG